jgi:hypothetical protein
MIGVLTGTVAQGSALSSRSVRPSYHELQKPRDIVSTGEIIPVVSARTLRQLRLVNMIKSPGILLQMDTGKRDLRASLLENQHLFSGLLNPANFQTTKFERLQKTLQLFK